MSKPEPGCGGRVGRDTLASPVHPHFPVASMFNSQENRAASQPDRAGSPSIYTPRPCLVQFVASAFHQPRAPPLSSVKLVTFSGLILSPPSPRRLLRSAHDANSTVISGNRCGRNAHLHIVIYSGFVISIIGQTLPIDSNLSRGGIGRRARSGRSLGRWNTP